MNFNSDTFLARIKEHKSWIFIILTAQNIKMEKNQIIIIATVAAVAAIRLYQKFIKKNKSAGTGTKTNSSDFASSKDDDYEPYSKK